ncbi:MAG TPA: dTDP-glucose 4,6-dehydratase [Candidatus Nanoarchaeia archaeon]|nr:dTDP-glucose 4,6-dehydratase [Candidatus Nanoarchaeia archaeon]
MKILVTGGAGFMGSNFTRLMVNKYPEHQIINLDKLTYAADLKSLDDIKNKKNYKFVNGDVCNFKFLIKLLKDVNCVVHLAAESHVDNSIGNSLIFTMSNTYGTHVLLEAARLNKIKKFLHVSTDEVYGDIEKGSFKEDSILSPNNPYSASKAGAEMIARSYYKTYRMPLTVVRSNNVYGPFQYPEKIIPRFITRLLKNKKIPLHGSGSNIRTYMFVNDFANALDLVFNKGRIGEIYNLGTSDEMSNLKLATLILKKLGKDDSHIDFVEDRPFNDRRYSVDTRKIKALGWMQQYSFEDGLNETIEWYKSNKRWWENKADKSQSNKDE